jgi:hypothetical protein
VFSGAIRVTSGDIQGLAPKWKRGYGRWVRDVLAWMKTPLYFRNELVPVDGIVGERIATHGEVRRLGDEAVVVEFASGKEKIAVAAKAEHRMLVTGRMSRLAGTVLATNDRTAPVPAYSSTQQQEVS